MNQEPETTSPAAGWQGLYRAGGVAGLLAGLLFRRNLAAEISLFSPLKPPEDLAGIFAQLQEHRALGLAYLNIFDLVNSALLGVMLLALYVLLRRTSRGTMAIAAALGFLGIAVYLASNTALSLLSLSGQYTAAGSAAERAALLAAGQALLAGIRFGGPGAQPGAGGYLSLLLVALSGLLISLVMLRSGQFGRATAIFGILAGALDLAYCLGFLFLPGVGGEGLALAFIPAAGLFWMLWQVLTGLRLYRLGHSPAQVHPVSTL